VQSPANVELRIPFVTLLKIALFALLVYIVIQLVPLLLMIFVGTLLAVVLSASADWLESKGVRRGLAVTVSSMVMIGAFILLLTFVIPQMIRELQGLVKNSPQIAQRINRRFPETAAYVNGVVAAVQRPANPQNIRQLMTRGVVAGRYAVEGLTAIALTLVMAIYLVVEGRRALAWMVSFAPDEQRRKLVQTAEEVQPVMLAYMRGQLITSTTSALAALAVLLPLRVPAALALAALAFIGDFIPVVGFIASLVPAVLLALIVSPTAALTVAAVYFGYQALENYVIAPRVYGKSMRLSTLTVLLAIAVGGTLLGAVGAVLVLPLFAAYPAVERIWLKRHLVAGTVEKHEKIEAEDDRESEKGTREALKK
jgi:predicted PurR-regulated permease PerM